LKIVWRILGFITLFLAFLGVALPLLPTVPFLLLSAFFFSKSSQRMHQWLMSHKLFGKMIEDWHERRAISRKAKYLATLSMGLVLGLSVLLALKPMVIGIQALVLSLTLLFIWTRSDG